MAYNKTTWVNGITKVDQGNLNNIEDGIETLDVAINEQATLPLNPTDSLESIIDIPDNTEGIFGIEVNGVPPISQEVENGDFSNGTTGWLTVGSTLSEMNNILSITGNGLAANPEAFLPNISFIANDIWFIYAKVKVTNSEADRVEIRNAAGFIRKFIDNPTANEWLELATIATIGSNVTDKKFQIFTSYPDASTANGKITEIDGITGIFAINMTANKIESYIEAQMLSIARQGYWERLKIAVLNSNLIMRGKNIFHGKFKPDTFITIGGTNSFGFSTGSRTSEKILCKGDTQYTVSGGDRNRWRFEDINNNVIIIALNDVITITSPIEAHHMFVYYSITGTETDIQIEENITSTTFEPFQNNIVSYNIPSDYPLIKLPNTKNNIINKVSRNYDVNNKKIILQNSDITSLNTSGTNVDRVICSIGLDGKIGTISIDGQTIPSEFENEIDNASIDLIASIGSHFYGTTITDLQLIVAKGTYVNLAAAQADLIGTNVFYELDVPFTILDGEQGYKAPSSVNGFENGDLIQIPKVDFYKTMNGETTIELEKAMIELTGVFAQLDDDIELELLPVTLSSDGLTITLDSAYTGVVHVIGEMHPKETLYTELHGDVPANIAGRVQNNSNAIATNSEKINIVEDDVGFNANEIIEIQDQIDKIQWLGGLW